MLKSNNALYKVCGIISSLYLLYDSLGMIDTWLIYVNWKLLRYFTYLVFVFYSIDFYKKETHEEIQQLS